MKINKAMIYEVEANKYDNELSTPSSFQIPSSFTWEPETIVVFLRDWLRKFNEYNECVPDEYIEEADGNEDRALDWYREDIEALADQFDFIVVNKENINIDIQPYVNSAFAKLAKLYTNLFW